MTTFKRSKILNGQNIPFDKKFARVGFNTGEVYPRDYSDASHPSSELAIYEYDLTKCLNPEFTDNNNNIEGNLLENLRDNNPKLPYFFQLHKVLPFDTDFSKEIPFNPELKPVNVIRAENIEKKFFPNNEAEIYLADTSDRGGTNSLKDPDAIAILYRLKELGHNSYSLASTGDCGASICHIASKLNMKIHLFIPDDCIDRWNELYEEMIANNLINVNLITIHNEGRTMHDAFDASVGFAEKNNIPHDYFFNNQLRIEGSKTIHIETMEAIKKAPDYYFQALGSGTGLFSMWKATHDLNIKTPQLVGVQPSGCSPMVRVSQGLDCQANADTHVMGIGLPKLGPAFEYLKKLNAKFIGVHEGGKKIEIEHIKSDIQILKEAGIKDPGLEASLTVSGLEKLIPEIQEKAKLANRKITIILGITGKMREGDRKNLAL